MSRKAGTTPTIDNQDRARAGERKPAARISSCRGESCFALRDRTAACVVHQAPVGERNHLFGGKGIVAVFAKRLLVRQAFSHRFIQMDDHRQKTTLGLQPDLIKVFLQRCSCVTH